MPESLGAGVNSLRMPQNLESTRVDVNRRIDETREELHATGGYRGEKLNGMQNSLKVGSEMGGNINDSNMHAMGPLDTGYG